MINTRAPDGANNLMHCISIFSLVEMFEKHLIYKKIKSIVMHWLWHPIRHCSSLAGPNERQSLFEESQIRNSWRADRRGEVYMKWITTYWHKGDKRLLGKTLLHWRPLHLGIAQIGFDPPTRTQPGTLGLGRAGHSGTNLRKFAKSPLWR